MVCSLCGQCCQCFSIPIFTGKKAAEPAKKPSHATIWVAKEFPPWQAFVLNTLQRLYRENGSALPDNSVIAATLKGEKSLGKYMKKIMPFVALLKASTAALILTSMRRLHYLLL